MAKAAKDGREGRTKVVAFRVSRELYEEIEEIRARAGLSLADLVKLGAGIAQKEVQDKLAELSGLRAKLTGVTDSIHREEEKLNGFISQERKRRLEALDVEIAAYKLFDRGWRIETVSHELKIPETRIRRYFKEAVERDLLKRCLKKHIDRLVEERLWGGVFGRLSKEELEADQKHIHECWRLLAAPEQMRQEDKEFLITKYSRILEPAPRSNRFSMKEMTGT